MALFGFLLFLSRFPGLELGFGEVRIPRTSEPRGAVHDHPNHLLPARRPPGWSLPFSPPPPPPGGPSLHPTSMVTPGLVPPWLQNKTAKIMDGEIVCTVLRDAWRDKCNNDQADWADCADGPQMAVLADGTFLISPEKNNCPHQSGGNRSSSPQGHTSQGTSQVGNSFSRGLAGVARGLVSHLHTH